MNRLKLEVRSLNAVYATAVSAIMIFIDFCVWCAIGSPAYILKFISSSLKVPPLWLFGLLDLLSFAVLGFSLGAVLGTLCSAYDVPKYRGAFFFVIGVTLAFLHHVIFFGFARFFFSLVVSVLSCAFLAAAVVDFFHVSKLSGVISVIGVLWRFYILILDVMTFFVM